MAWPGGPYTKVDTDKLLPGVRAFGAHRHWVLLQKRVGVNLKNWKIIGNVLLPLKGNWSTAAFPGAVQCTYFDGMGLDGVRTGYPIEGVASTRRAKSGSSP